MQPWKAVLAIAPAGLLLGLVAGQASKPVMLVKDERPWPQSVGENAVRADRWQATYDGGPLDFGARGYSHRPDLDYELYAWPDQSDRSVELLAAGYEYGADGASYVARFDQEVAMPQTRRAVAELAAMHAERLPAEATQIAAVGDRASEPAPIATDEAKVGREAFVLPPVPPPLARAGDASEQGKSSETETF